MKYEYQIAEYSKILSARDLNDYGQDGWELVSVLFPFSGFNSGFQYIFKRKNPLTF